MFGENYTFILFGLYINEQQIKINLMQSNFVYDVALRVSVHCKNIFINFKRLKTNLVSIKCCFVYNSFFWLTRYFNQTK